jgi:hypothetical protein
MTSPLALCDDDTSAAVEKRDSPAKREEAAEEESERPVKTVESDDAIAAPLLL